MRPFAHVRATSLEQAVAAARGDGARLLAGGTTLFDLMKLNVEAPATLVDISALPDLQDIAVSRRGLTVGALAKMADVAEHRDVRARYPALSESLTKAASQQLRNMATVGGNLLQRTRCGYFRGGAPYPCNKRAPGSGCAAIDGADRNLALLGTSDACIANYPGDWAVALVAFDAEIDILGSGGLRRIAVEALHRDPGSTPHIETVLEPGDVITRIHVPASRALRASTYHKVRDRASYAFALVSAAVGIDVAGGRIRDARIALGGVGARPLRVREAEAVLQGQRYTRALAIEAGEAALRGARTSTHNAFRVPLGVQTVADAIGIAMERA
ncbi:xanthine dehydrogenase family protein subunit M [Luteimonas sp BLCC-B24]|uniref:FAD binding domain-containing protein n=1 Tax=Luteimonas sp. BLCC-B24 TaxID=3025317 RepID=UPI00234D84F3|nr:xanthine dehydrogenase family protein subunit M [Luteimonas sp. BLCC-B24]MDC7806765.1 xanthine dehydrogenase family protein subunit M [Luteimonas sp. BLCC-B24]